jgi:hypothetical protein
MFYIQNGAEIEFKESEIINLEYTNLFQLLENEKH